MIEGVKELKKVKAWANQAETDLQKYNQPLGELQQCLKEMRAADQIEKMREQESMEEYRKQKRYQEEYNEEV